MNPDSLNCTNEGFFSSLSEKLCLITTVSIIWPGLMRKNVAQPGQAPKQFLREEKIANSFYFLCSRNFSEAIFIWCTALYTWCRLQTGQVANRQNARSLFNLLFPFNCLDTNKNVWRITYLRSICFIAVYLFSRGELWINKIKSFCL